MEAIEQKVRAALFSYFTPEEIQFETNPDDRISGTIVSSRFDGKNDLARQRKIWGRLRKTLSKAEQRKIVGFLAYTPGEYEAYNEPVLTSE